MRLIASAVETVLNALAGSCPLSRRRAPAVSTRSAISVLSVVSLGLSLLLLAGADARAGPVSSARSQRLLAAEGPKPLLLGSVVLRVVDAGVPSELRETVTVPANGQLLVGFGVQLGDAGADAPDVRDRLEPLELLDSDRVAAAERREGPPGLGPVEIRIAVSRDGETQVVFRERPPARDGSIPWRERFVDLADHAGETLELSFSARAVGPSRSPGADIGGARVWWQAPVLYTPTRSGDPPNVIVVVLDTLRADHLSSYGHSRDTAPAIASFASRGVVFEQAFSQAPWTLPSMVSIFTGLRPSRHGVVHATRALSPASVTLPGILHRAGYYSAGFHNGGYLSYAFGFHHFFDHYEQIDGLRSMPRVLEWIEEHQSVPFFLFLHSYDVHAPYGSVPQEYHSRYAQVPAQVVLQGSGEGSPEEPMLVSARAAADPATLGRFDLVNRKPAKIEASIRPERFEDADYQLMRDLYDGEVRFVDDRLGEMFAVLAKLKLRQRTIVILLSDHGEEFGEHGRVEHHNGNLYRELVHIPLVISGPGIAQARRVEQLVEAVDVLPTVLELLGLDAMRLSNVDGRSLVPLLLQQADAQETAKRYAVSQTHDHRGALVLRNQNWTLLESRRDGLRLFDRRLDPDETTDVQEAHPEVVERLRLRLGKLAEEGGHKQTPARPVEDEETQAELRALGYLE